MKISGIYRIQSKQNPERCYIGSTAGMKKRWWGHLSNLRFNKHPNQKLQRHFNKYGESDLVFIILELCFPEFLTAREQYYINELKPYFNICKIAGSPLGVKHTEKAKQRMSIAHKGLQAGKNHPLYGKHHSEEAKRKMSEANKGKNPWNKGRTGVYSEETRKKLSEANKGIIPINVFKKGCIPWNKGISKTG